ncbi:MAG: molybdopterin-dependent oxidoreductase, partial [Thaumarchaeota archaeon]|nr:molybdopterin-dependent oxidoreductase [Nitrososphaerota archaeon]
MSYRVLTTSAINNEPVVLASSRSFRPVNNGIIRTTCSLCQNFCGLFALVKDGKVLRVEGDPDNPRNHGHLCAKGLSGYLSLYSPKRITRPLLRTNPAKGLGVDPKWKEISWNEAIDIVANRIREVRRKLGVGQDDQDIVSWKGGSGKILITTFDHPAMYSGAHRAWAIALDAIMVVMGAACYCGNAVHPPSFLNTSTFEITPDAEYAKYLLLIGSQAGSIIHYDTMNVARHIAEKRPGNVKVVVVDPMCAYAAARSEEWIPIRPGTDGALIMSLINLMVNEYKIYDSDFLMEKTNAPYLVGEDGLYVRDDQNRPLIWDAVNGAPKAITDIATKNCALEGSYVVNGKACKPSFQLIKDHAKRYSPEMAAEITSIPEETIRRIAKELGEAACIGKTIVVDGMELPYRPVSVVWYRGISAHKHAYLTGFAAMMIPTLLGAIQVPGGISGHPPAKEETDVDGMMVSKAWLGSPYPPRPVKKPRRVDLYDLFPVGHGSSPLTIPV